MMKPLTWALWVVAGGLEIPAGGVDEPKPGLLGEYFHIGTPLGDFPRVEGKMPVLRRIDRELNWEPTGEKFAGTDLVDQFYVRWSGLIRIPKAGTYTFYTESDDGSRLWIDGKLVVDNGGLHHMEERTGALELKAGDHEIRVDLFQNDGDVGLKVCWQGQGLAKEIIPAAALFHQPDGKLDARGK